MESLWKDFRYAGKALIRAPGFTLVAILVLAVGIGANTAIFSLINSLLLRPLPGVEAPNELVGVYRTTDGRGLDTVSYPTYVDYSYERDSLTGLMAYQFTRLAVRIDDVSRLHTAAIVSGNYFDVLRVEMAIGRGFSAEEGKTPGAHPVVVLGHGFRQRQFGGDDDILGKTIIINSHPFTVIGVTPKRFVGTEYMTHPDLYVPLMMQTQARPRSWNVLETRDNNWLRMIGRLAPGATVAQVDDELNAVAQALEFTFPDMHRGQRVAVIEGLGINADDRGEVQRIAGLLLVMAILVLLTACGNLAGLLLARSSTRHREVGIRLAVGARRFHVIRMLLAESCLLSFIGAIFGLVFANWLADLTVSMASLPPELDPKLDGRVLGFTLLVSLLSGLVFGLTPALVASKPDLVPVLQEAQIGPTPLRSRFREILVILQVAFSLALLTLGGFLIRGLMKAQKIDPGFRHKDVLVSSVGLGLHGYTEERGQAFFRELEERLKAIPGAESVALSAAVPLRNRKRIMVTIEGDVNEMDFEHCSCAPTPEGDRLPVEYNVVTADYFKTIDIPIVKGRTFDSRDSNDGAESVIVNETLAGVLWPDGYPLGGRVRVGPIGLDNPGYEVVGVVRDSKYLSLGERDRPHFYRPAAQQYESTMAIFVQTDTPGETAAAIRREVQQMDANLPALRVSALTRQLSNSISQERLIGTLIMSFGGLALVLVGIGLYGLTAFMVKQREHEVALRLALGGSAKAITRLMVRKSMQSTLIGLVLGLAGSLALAPQIAGFVPGSKVIDIPALVAMVALLLVIVTIASYLPARRVTRVEAVRTLREE